MPPPLLTLAIASELSAPSSLDLALRGWLTLLVLVGLGIAAQTVVERADRDRAHRVAVVVCLAAASLLLSPGQIVLAALLLYLPRWLKTLQAPWQAHAFELSADLLGGTAAWGAASALGHLVSGGIGAEASLAVSGLGACLALAGAGRLPLLLGARRKGDEEEQGGRVRPPALALGTELALAALGIALSAMWLLDPWLLPFAAAPFLLVQRSFRIPLLEHQARLDPKTGLFNAAYFDVALERELARARAFGRPLAVMVADLDLLREINSAHGHLGGDAVIRGVATILEKSLRPQDVAARFGGEELAVILPGVDASGALSVAERLRRAVASTAFSSRAGGGPIRASLSIGVAAFPEHGTTATELVHRADLAVYRAKLQGRNRVVAASRDPLATPLELTSPGKGASPAPAEEVVESEAKPTPEEGRARPRLFPLAVALLSASAASSSVALVLASKAPVPALVLAAVALALTAATVAALRRRSDLDQADRALQRARRLWQVADSLHARVLALERANRLLQKRSRAALEALSAAVDARDAHAAGHSRRVERLALAIGRELGLSRHELEVLEVAARLHDIGKLTVPEAVLLKPSRLDPDEWSLVERHPEEGERLIAQLGFLADALPAIRHHHERYDGSGYPDGLAGEEIPLGARIIHLADALDAMLTPRVYRPALSPAEALEELRRGSGSQFCPRCLEALERVMLAELAQGADVPAELLAC